MAAQHDNHELLVLTDTSPRTLSRVDAAFPGLFPRNEGGDTVYGSHYTHEIASHFMQKIALQRGTRDRDGARVTDPVYGGPAIMYRWLSGAEKTAQDARLRARNTQRKASRPVPVRDTSAALGDATDDVETDTIEFFGVVR